MRYQDLPENIQNDIFVNSVMIGVAINRITDLCSWDKNTALDYLVNAGINALNSRGEAGVLESMRKLDEIIEDSEDTPGFARF